MLGGVDGHLRQVEGDDPVVAGDGFFDHRVEHPGFDPGVAAASQRGLRSLAEPAGHVPRAARHQPEQDRRRNR